MKNFLLLIMAVCVFSCQQKENKDNPVVQTSESALPKQKEEQNKQVGDTIFIHFKNDESLATAEGVIDSIHSRIFVKFKNDNPGKLNGSIKLPTNTGNIRFNQIIFPNKTLDGPFGTDLNMDIEQKGNYILVIGHSQMAENPYWGKFNLQLENKKK